MEFLEMAETRLERTLRGVSLVAEVDVPEGLIDKLAASLGQEYKCRRTEGASVEVMFKRRPACVAVAMAGVAAQRYQKGTYWPALWKAVRYGGYQEDQRVWGDGFRVALVKLGLPVFADNPLPYVGPIVMHAGIPTYCLEDFFRLLLQRQSQDPRLDAETFLAWATGSGRESRLYSLDVPARRFLQYGSDFALDIVERSLELLDRLRESGESLDGLGLPSRFVQRAQELAEQGLFDTSPPVDVSRRKQRQERPRLELDPYGRGVAVWLPPIGDAPDGTARWHVTEDGVPHTVKSQTMWVDAAEGVPATTHALSRPVRSVQVRLAGWDHDAELRVVDKTDPLLLFGDDGRLISATLPLPPSSVWALYPAGRDLDAHGTLRVIGDGILPVGWSDWRLQHLDLADVTSLGLADGTRQRVVRGYTRPRLEQGAPVPGVTTPYGSPVFAELPVLWLPGEPDAQTTWQVEIRSRVTGEAIVRRSIETSAPQLVDDLWRGVQRPLLGAFDVSIRGPLARGIRRSLFIAEGLSVRYLSDVRLFTRSGLTPAQAELSAPTGAHVAPARMRFAEQGREQLVAFDVPALSEPLVVSPPHVQVFHEHSDESSAWSTGALRLTVESFLTPGSLIVHVPGVLKLPPVQVRGRPGVLQELEPTGRVRDGMARYDLKRIADTVAEHRRVDLVLPVGAKPCVLANVEPEKLASAVEHCGDRLRLVDAAEVEGVIAGIYVLAAPWRAPVRLPVMNGNVELPSELRACGPLRVVLRVGDPWVPVELPRWPEAGSSYFCDATGWFDTGDIEEAELSRFLVGQGAFPATVWDMTRLWVMVDLAAELSMLVPESRIAEHCGHLLRAHTARALQALVDAELQPERSLRALIATGMAASRPDRPIGNTRLRRMWASNPAVAAMMDADDDDWWDCAEMECGQTAVTVLLGDEDQDAAVGGFGREVDALAAMTVEQVDYVWQAAMVVPQDLLDPDSRVVAARQLFDQRLTADARAAGNAARHSLSAADELIARSYHPELAKHVAARRHGDRGGWRLLPAVSSAIAMVARLAARGDEAAAQCEARLRAEWLHLAAIAPKLVTIDLVLAELLIKGREMELA
ncbi:hypothetical protein [Haloechinothrix salitolerans]|uniref:Thiopeptide-type bacteriocin biosynthesis domain-containing protein n=1 Tax=Haloechinothrix salitolerans TaxID=926830 RepID=A0ABW2C8J9_9PSEU